MKSNMIEYKCIRIVTSFLMLALVTSLIHSNETLNINYFEHPNNTMYSEILKSTQKNAKGDNNLN